MIYINIGVASNFNVAARCQEEALNDDAWGGIFLQLTSAC